MSWAVAWRETALQQPARVVIHPPLWAPYRTDATNRAVEVLQVGRPGIDLPHENLPPNSPGS